MSDVVQGWEIPSAFVTHVAASEPSITILAANPVRKRVILQNNAAGEMYISFGASCVSATKLFSLRLAKKAASTDTFYFDSGIGPIYTGAISACWSTGAGGVQVTEF